VTFGREWLIHRFDSVASTMEAAAELAVAGAPDRTVVVSQEQTRGRGRGGRTWNAPRGTALFCTLLVRPAVPAECLTILPLVTGVAVAETIEDLTGARVQLKWPNDVWLGDDSRRRKVAGILVSSRLRAGSIDHVLVGVGINVSTGLDALPAGATSLLAATGRDVTPDQVLPSLLSHFDGIYADFLALSGRPSLDPWRARAALTGEQVTIDDTSHGFQGIFGGVDDDGALILFAPDGTRRRIVSGDLVRGPRTAG
jgi:BirA family biotin operon repressor/biotin-[acetyl-CoA-carboxylase] ligase